MISLKKLGLVVSTLAFCMTLAVSASYAQPGKARYEGNNGKHKGWTKGKHKGWENRDDRYDNRNDRLETRNRRAYSRGRLSAAEYRRLEQRRARLDNRQDRYEASGRGINNRENRRLGRQYTRYNRAARRARNN